jgi:predicted nucleic acid-binding protein
VDLTIELKNLQGKPLKTLYQNKPFKITQVSNNQIILKTSKDPQKAGHIYAKLEQQGQPIGLRDTFIAAIALTRECSVATRNQAHFNRISGLNIITP